MYAKILVEHFNFERFLTFVDPHVLLQTVILGERFPTRDTCKRLLACMDSHVVIQITSTIKLLLTYITLEWRFPCVCEYVLF